MNSILNSDNLQTKGQEGVPEFIDVHAHVNFPDYEKDREEVVRRALDAGVWMINVGTTLQSSRDIVALAEKYEKGIYSIVGLHPTHVSCEHDTNEGSEGHGGIVGQDGFSNSYSHEYHERFDVAAFEPLVAHPKTVAIGECGLDVFRLDPRYDKAEVLRLQEEDFRKQIGLALKYDKPIMIHARGSYGRILEIIDEYLNRSGVRLRGNAHFFAGTVEEAKAFLDRGFTLSFTGVITFAKQYKELVEFIPLERMLSETDCPFVTPVPFRGQRNEPLYVREVVSKIADIKALDVETVKKMLFSNAVREFRLKI